jgi:hypothetical protein
MPTFAALLDEGQVLTLAAWVNDGRASAGR